MREGIRRESPLKCGSMSGRMLTRTSWLLLCGAVIGFAAALGEREVSGDIYSASGRNLGYMSQSYGRHKCLRQVPSVLFRTEKDEQVTGNGTNAYFHEVIDCCEGYKRYKYDWNRCEPDCGDRCENGFCRAPGHCECFDGFVANDRGRCVFACPLGCENGVCYLNGTCRCNAGYRLDPSKSFCQPVCRTACGRNQMCVAPNACGCREGYQMTAIGCQPICTPDCGHGRCVAPNQCECFAGFAMRPPRKVCEADSPLVCENGFCDSRYQCVCHDGYRYDKTTTSCLPDCGDKCENGVCREPGICECFVGYRARDDTCVPICENGCGYYGRCVAPGVCGCAQSGQLCNFGMCDSLGRCICNDGTMRFIHECVVPNRLETLVASFEQRQRYNQKLKEEFHNLIGKHFTDLYSF